MGCINIQKRRRQQRIARRKLKVQRLIRQEKARRAALDSVTFLHRHDYLRLMNKIQARLYRLTRELRVLEAGRLTGIGAGEQPETEL